MSMLSDQCDELRRLADGQASYRDARDAMLRAADTIWELRNKCAVLRDENERLEQEMMTRCGECVAMLDCDECLRADADHKARKALAYENERLRDELEDERTENGWALEFMNRMGEKVRCSDATSLKEYVEKIEAENKRLLKDRNVWFQAHGKQEQKCFDLVAENAKLRERYLHECQDNEFLRELCADMAAELRGLGIDFKRVGWCDYADRMRELGVEVDE